MRAVQPVRRVLMRAALIGINGQGVTLAKALTRIDGAALVAGYHPDAARARAWDTGRGTSNLSAMLSRPDIDAVLIASPTHLHGAHILACLEAGKSIFVEKPVVNSYAECEQLWRAAQSHPVPTFMVGHNVRRSGWARAIKQIIDEGRLGRLVDVEMSFSHGGGFQFGTANWRGSLRHHREGPMNARGIHVFDLLHDWLGPIRRVYANLRNVAGVTESPDAVTSAALKMPPLNCGASFSALTVTIDDAAGLVVLPPF